MLFFAAGFSVSGAESGIIWKKVGKSGITLSTSSSKTLTEMLDALLQQFALHPEKIQIDAAVQSLPEIAEVQGHNPETVLKLLLSRHDLSLISRNGLHRIVLRSDVWRFRPFKKIINSPVPSALASLWAPLCFIEVGGTSPLTAPRSLLEEIAPPRFQ